MKSITEQEQCENCHAQAIIVDPDKGDIVCRKCGVVKEEKVVDMEREEMHVSRDGSNEGRIGPPLLNRGINNVIPLDGHDASGRALSTQTKKDMQRLRKWDQRAPRRRYDKGLYDGVPDIEKVCTKLGLGKAVQAQAVTYLHRAFKEKLFRGRSIATSIPAFVYIACQMYGVARNLEDIVEASGEKRKAITRTHRYFYRKFDIKPSVLGHGQTITRAASVLHLPEHIVRDAVLISEKLVQMHVSAGKKSGAMSAACIYIACIQNNISVSQKQIARATGVTDVTIRNRLKELKKMKETAPHMKELISCIK